VDIVTADWTAKLGCVAAGLGVALIPALAARAAPPDITLLRLHTDDAPVRQVFAATSAGRQPPAAAARLLDCLSAASRELG
jgi:DNA-binding transcriptional LysR family regulator